MNNKLENELNREDGFTLVEILVVVVIIGLLIGMFGSKVFSSADRAYADMTRTKMLQIKNSVDEFKLRYRRLPQSFQDLTSCTDITGSGCIPIIDDPEEIRDAWGNDLIYEPTGGRKFIIKSYGADGQSGGTGVDTDLTVEGP